MTSAHALIACAVLWPAAALAAPAAQTLPPQPKPALVLSDGVVSIGDASSKPDPQPTNRTSVARQFGPQATVSAGYLCGLTPLSDRTPGPASTFGPVGTFLGGQLTLAFK
ncbi:MAG TPA: hypothetical protein VMU59_03830 [Caulobacteraceae bacterium]|nr:hypothetical protein [Caulobacteraceae bacterium]